jgi:hypothetical protein
MARFDGLRQGLGVWLVALLMTAALAATALIGDGDVNPLASLDLPRVPIADDGELTRGGAIATAAIALVTLLAALGGGIAGERFHRAVDLAGDTPPEPEQLRLEPQPRAELEELEAETEHAPETQHA